MKALMQTDIYAQTAKKFSIEPKVRDMVAGKSGTALSTDDLAQLFNTITRSFRDPIFSKAMQDFKAGHMIFIYCKDMTQCLPPFMPFVKYAVKGEPKIVVDLSYMLSEKEGEYSARQLESLYAIVIVAEMTLRLFDAHAVLPATVIDATANMWAKMYCKVLNRTIALNTNRDRYNAFYYFAIQFYCRYILETPDVVANDVATSFLKDGKSMLIQSIESEVLSRGIPMYESFQNFCNTMFNNEITGVHGGLRGSKSELNYVTYLSAFMGEFDKSSLFALAAFPYFLLVITRVNVGSRDINRRALEEIMLNPKSFAQISKEMAKDL